MIWNLILINFFVFSLNPLSISDKTLHFDIVHKSDIVGDLIASKRVVNSKTYYESSTTIKTKIIREFSINYTYNVLFNDENLEKADVHITVNDKPHAETLTKWNDTNYQVVKDNTVENPITETITYATIQLYFKEPKNISSCYSEQDASFNTIVSMGDHIYKKVNSKGNENLYYYEKGTLKKATIDGGLIKFEIIRNNKH